MMKSSYIRKRERSARRRQRIIAGKTAYPTVGERLRWLFNEVKYAACFTLVGSVVFVSPGAFTNIAKVYAQEVGVVSEEQVLTSVDSVVCGLEYGVKGPKVLDELSNAVREEDYYTSPTTHQEQSSEITSYNVTVGAYDYETAIYGGVYDERITEGQPRLLQGDSVTLTPRVGYTLEITNTNADKLDNGGLYEDLLETCSVTGIYVNVDECGYFTINGKNIMQSTTVSDIQEILGISLQTDDGENYHYNNDYVELSFRWADGKLYELSATATATLDSDDAYPVLRNNMSVMNPEEVSMETVEFDSLGTIDVCEKPVVLGGYSLGNWTTREMVVQAFGECEDDSPSYVMGEYSVTFMFNGNYLYEVSVELL